MFCVESQAKCFSVSGFLCCFIVLVPNNLNQFFRTQLYFLMFHFSQRMTDTQTPDTFSNFSRFLGYQFVCLCMCFVCFQFLWCSIGLRSVVGPCVTDLFCQNFCNDSYVTRPKKKKKIRSAFSEVLPSMFLCLFIKASE